MLTGKRFDKNRKMVYEKIFRKPFSKTRDPLPLIHASALSLSLLSFSLAQTLSCSPRATANHPESASPRTTPSLPAPGLPSQKPSSPSFLWHRKPPAVIALAQQPLPPPLSASVTLEISVCFDLFDVLVRQEPVLLMIVMICGF